MEILSPVRSLWWKWTLCKLNHQ